MIDPVILDDYDRTPEETRLAEERFASKRHAPGYAVHLVDASPGWEVRTGQHIGDTAEVLVYPLERACAGSPIVFRFVGTGPRAKVLEAGTSCSNP